MTAHENKFGAFLSYSQLDNVPERAGQATPEPRRWADWLHEALRTFVVPAEFIGQENGRGELVPERIAPIFQDATEQADVAELTPEVRQALEKSVCLVVICSPRSARSQHVNEAVRYFKQLGRAHCILPLAIAGEPHANESDAATADECFVPALRHPVLPDGTLDTSRRAGKFIFVDARHGATKREILAADQREAEADLEMAKIQLIALLLSVGFNGLWWREQRRHFFEFAEARRQAELALAQVAAIQQQLSAAQQHTYAAQQQALDAQNLSPDVAAQIQAAQAQARTAQEQLQTLQEQVRATQAQLAEAQQRSLASESQVQEFQQQLRLAHSQLEAARQQVSAAETAAATARAQAESAEQQRQALQNQSPEVALRVEAAQTEAQTAHAQLSAAQAQAQQAQQQVHALEAQLADLRLRMQVEISAAHAQAEQARQQVAELQSETQAAQERFAAAQQNAEALQQQIHAAQNQLAEARQQAQSEILAAQKQAQQQDRTAQQQLAETRQQVFAAQAEVAAAQAEARATQTKLDELQQQNQRVLNQVAAAQTDAQQSLQRRHSSRRLTQVCAVLAVLALCAAGWSARQAAQQRAAALQAQQRAEALVAGRFVATTNDLAPDGLRQLLQQIGGPEQAQNRRASLAAIVAALPAAEIPAALQTATVMVPGETRTYFQLALLTRWQQADLTGAFRAVCECSDTALRDRALEIMLPALTATATVEQSAVLNHIVVDWAKQDAPAALRFACTHSDTFGAALVALTRAWFPGEIVAQTSGRAEGEGLPANLVPFPWTRLLAEIPVPAPAPTPAEDAAWSNTNSVPAEVKSPQ